MKQSVESNKFARNERTRDQMQSENSTKPVETPKREEKPSTGFTRGKIDFANL